MTEQDIKAALLHLCKPSNLDSDFNVTAFHVLCRELKQLGASEERKHLEAELLKLKDGVAASSDYIQGRWDLIGEFQDVIRARGQS